MAFLTGVRVLDFTDERGLITGRILADLGADVVHVEPANGSTARSFGPLSSEGTSYLWKAYAANQRSVQLDPNAPSDRAQLDKLLAKADILIESSGPVVWQEVGLDWENLRESYPELIYVSITGYGRTGPKASYAESDLTLWASGGTLDPHRDGTARPPVRPSIPQAHRLAGADAAAGALFALNARHRTKRGQLVEVAVQAALSSATLAMVLAEAVGDRPREMAAGQELVTRVDRSGSGSGSPAASKKWRASDGMIEFHISVGAATGGFTGSFFRWMLEEGHPVQELVDLDWRSADKMIESGELSAERIAEIRAKVASFLSTKSKDEVLQAAVKYKLLCVPIYTTKDLVESKQMLARGLYTAVGEGARKLTVPGFPADINVEAIDISRPAPLRGEHTTEVLSDWAVESSGRLISEGVLA